MDRQNKRALADLRHRDRKKRLQKLLAARTTTNQVPIDSTAATVINVARGFCTIFDGSCERLIRCDLPAAPGDEVCIRHERVTGVALRRTVLTRPDPGNPHHLLTIAANVDMLVIVAPLVDPPFRAGLVDRYLIASMREGIQPLLCLNKSDLGGHTSIAETFEIPKLRCSAHTGEGIEDLRGLLARNTAVFVGHSGVGKTSLLNALTNLRVETGAVSDVTGKGRHTTTASRLYVLDNGGRIIDTPGIREFGLGEVTRAELDSAFPEFAATHCRFSDCKHRGEPGCGVADARGARYERWLRLQTG